MPFKKASFEILDEQGSPPLNSGQDHVEYVKMVNTDPQKDNYVVPLAMANKTVTKNLG